MNHIFCKGQVGHFHTSQCNSLRGSDVLLVAVVSIPPKFSIRPVSAIMVFFKNVIPVDSFHLESDAV